MSFHVQTHKHEDARGKEPDDVARLEKAWRSKHQRKTDYLIVQSGDHLMVPFECHLLRILEASRKGPASEKSIRRIVDCLYQKSYLGCFLESSNVNGE